MDFFQQPGVGNPVGELIESHGPRQISHVSCLASRLEGTTLVSHRGSLSSRLDRWLSLVDKRRRVRSLTMRRHSLASQSRVS